MTSSPTVKRLGQGRVQCLVTFAPEETAKAEERVVASLGRNVSLPGFRPGKAPADVLRAKLDPQRVFEETIRELLRDKLAALAKDNDIRPILPPKVEAQSRDPLTVAVTFVEKPEVKVKGGAKITVDKKEVKADAKDVERMVKYLVDQYRTTTVVDRVAKEGDEVTMDFVGTDAEGKEVPGIRTKGYDVVLGSKTLLPGFEEKLVGMKKDDSTSFTLTFPDKYHAEHLRNKPVTFAVTVTAVKEVHQPELTDAFAKEKGLGESVAAVKQKIEESMRGEEERIEQQRRERALFEAIREATKVDLAPELVEHAVQNLVEEMSHELQHQNSSFEAWMQQSGKKPEEIRKDLEEQAKKRLTLRFGIEALLDERKIEATDDELKAHLQKGQTLPDPNTEEFEQLRWQVRIEKLINELLKA